MSKWQYYTAPNLGLLFYKQLYNDVLQNNKNILDIEKDALIFKVDKKESEFIAFYNDMYSKKLNTYDLSPENRQLGNISFSLFTTYPGLLIGSGYMHSTNTTGDATIGFYFDHTSGLPTIPGSSVKGVLKSMFEAENDKTDQTSVDTVMFFIDRIIENIPEQEKQTWSDLKSKINNIAVLNELKEEIFGTQQKEGKDVFFDAVIDFEKTKASKFIGSDYITPHQPNLLKNPIPLQFLKVLPNIGFQFNFHLKDGLLTKEQKEILFKKIILTIGVGAKTNVGYGQFSETPLTSTNNYNEEINTETFNDTSAISLEIGSKYKTKIKRTEQNSYFIDFAGKEFKKTISQKEFDKLNIYKEKDCQITIDKLNEDGTVKNILVEFFEEPKNKKQSKRW